MMKLKKACRSVLEKLNFIKYPIECSLFMTEVCNFKCKGCRRSIIDIHNSKDIDLNTVKKLISVYPQLRGFCLAGQGEPTLCSNFIEIVDFLKNKGKMVNVVTNGSNIDKFLGIKTQPDCITISLYGFDNQSYEKYCGLSVFDEVVANFQTLKERFKNVGFSYIVNKETYLDLTRVLELCDKLKPDFLNIVNYLAYDPELSEEVDKIITVNDTDVIEYINNLFTDDRVYIKDKPYYINPINNCFNCNSYLKLLNVDGDGCVGGCRSHIVPSQIYGNIFEDKDPFRSKEMVRLRALVKNKIKPHPSCSYCFRREK